MAQYINREKLLKRMEGYCEANCGCKPYEDALCPSCGLGDAIYMVEEQRIVNTRSMKRRKDAIEVVSKTEKTTQWIPVSERLPEEMDQSCGGWSEAIRPSVDVLVWLSPEERQSVAWYSYTFNEWTTVDENTMYHFEEVTHWMPLPEPPKEEA